ncbi:MAG TPA: hypothetical protein D7I06_01020 [Candidatus Poseidoniales archaeon]|nr:MAG TPA: hypothetical protein D7I06_01020 [Candidatus Poseidoniales archaeon]
MEKNLASMDIVAKKNWAYCVYDSGDGYIISIPFGHSFVDFSKAFKLNLDSMDEEYLTKKAEDIKNNYENYKQFEVPDPYREL